MPLSELIQRLIHILDVGAGSRVVRVLMIMTIFCGRCLWADLRDYQNFSTPEAMDSAQLARNISEGRGYTTDFIRPLSLFLVKRWNEARSAGKPAAPNADFARLETGHPDLANTPVYPLLLAGLMKVLPFDYVTEVKKPFWSDGGQFARYEPDFVIATFNQLLLLVVILQTFLIARRLFGHEVAWISALLVFGCEMLWDFSLSGLSTMLVMVIFLGITHLLLVFDQTAREATPEKPARNQLFALAIAAGLLAGLGVLTRYAFGWVMAPVAAFLLLNGGPNRWRQVWCACGAFLLMFGPWLLRNYLASGMPLGTAGFAIAEGTDFFPGFQLERTLHPNLTDVTVVRLIAPYIGKLWSNLGGILQNDLPALGHSWATVLFLAGLLIPFRGVPIRRLRYFLLMALGTFAVVQSLGRTQLSDLSPVVNSENLLILVMPLVLIFGTVFFFTLNAQWRKPEQLPIQPTRYAIMGAFVFLMCLPSFGKRFDGKTDPVAYPPYYPPEIQLAGNWMKPNEMLMSDIPWAVAWYGDTEGVGLALDAKNSLHSTVLLQDATRPPTS